MEESKRGDVFGRTVLRRKGNVTAEEAVDKDCLADKTLTHKFAV